MDFASAMMSNSPNVMMKELDRCGGRRELMEPKVSNICSNYYQKQCCTSEEAKQIENKYLADLVSPSPCPSCQINLVKISCAIACSPLPYSSMTNVVVKDTRAALLEKMTDLPEKSINGFGGFHVQRRSFKICESTCNELLQSCGSSPAALFGAKNISYFDLLRTEESGQDALIYKDPAAVRFCRQLSLPSSDMSITIIPSRMESPGQCYYHKSVNGCHLSPGTIHASTQVYIGLHIFVSIALPLLSLSVILYLFRSKKEVGNDNGGGGIHQRWWETFEEGSLTSIDTGGDGCKEE